MAIHRRYRLYGNSRRGVAGGCARVAADLAKRTGFSISRSHPVRDLRRDLRHAGRHRTDAADAGQAPRTVAAWTNRDPPRARGRNRRTTGDSRGRARFARQDYRRT